MCNMFCPIANKEERPSEKRVMVFRRPLSVFYLLRPVKNFS
ncbi:hypothetical protein HMPREF9123_2631 [Neisseria bacilliformis ATCC BAA-1200]|uniref:Uncharacterized protein n=1 Tax=Neisseria bacilliformis ATCC BAA-1200 TaxID=888742 RepID=F2BFX4_9NEIS|nr:hypothetical protein HMPREF9123_2631 [Neisseria bacilliformis ATCC BAA-1200]